MDVSKIPGMTRPLIQRQLSLNAATITFYHTETNNERQFLRSSREANDANPNAVEDFDIKQAVSAVRFYRAMLKKYVTVQKALKHELKSRKKPKAPFPVPETRQAQLH